MTTFANAALDPASPIADEMQLTLAEARDVGGATMGLGWIVGKTPSGLIASHGGDWRLSHASHPATGNGSCDGRDDQRIGRAVG